MIQPIFANLGALDTPAVLIIAAVAVLLFGGSKLATFGKSLGEGLKEFKKAVKDESDAPQPENSSKPLDSASNQPAAATSEEDQKSTAGSSKKE